MQSSLKVNRKFNLWKLKWNVKFNSNHKFLKKWFAPTRTSNPLSWAIISCPSPPSYFHIFPFSCRIPKLLKLIIHSHTSSTPFSLSLLFTLKGSYVWVGQGGMVTILIFLTINLSLWLLSMGATSFLILFG